MQVFLKFMFTQVGVIVLIGLYMVGGAFMFQHIEQDSLMEHAIEAENVGNYSIILNCNIFNPTMTFETSQKTEIK